jgi:hypothetical protein
MMIRAMKAALIAALVVVAGAAGAGCGGDNVFEGKQRPARAPEDVIRAWADSLRRGDVRGAAEFFALPSVVSNGTPPIVLRTRGEARAFNSALPCGARLLRTFSSGRFTTALFRLTERPGAGRCGAGTGDTARTTFVVRDGKIVQWRRVADSPEPSWPVV